MDYTEALNVAIDALSGNPPADEEAKEAADVLRKMLTEGHYEEDCQGIALKRRAHNHHHRGGRGVRPPHHHTHTERNAICTD